MSEAVKEVARTKRPEIRNIHVTQILGYRLPLAGLVSILHRISGALMFLLLPFILYLFEQSIVSEVAFAHLKGIAEQPLTKLVILALAWAYIQHFCAGVRHLVMDTHRALDKQSARQTAASVLLVTAVLTLLVALKLFGAF